MTAALLALEGVRKVYGRRPWRPLPTFQLDRAGDVDDPGLGVPG